MFKRIGSIALTAAMLISMLCTFSVASAADGVMTLTCTANKEEAERNDEIVVTIGLKDCVEVRAIGITGTYDTALLEYVGAEVITSAGSGNGEVTPSDPNDGETAFFEESPDIQGVLIGVWARPTDGYVGAGSDTTARVICKITFKVKETAGIDKEAAFKFKFIPSAMGYGGEDASNDFPKLESSKYSTGEVTDAVKIICNHDYKYEKLAQENTPFNVVNGANGAKHLKVCTKCDYYEEEFCSDPDPVEVPATHTEDGYVKYTCDDCGYIYTVKTDDAKGHKYDGVSWAPNPKTVDQVSGEPLYTHSRKCVGGDAVEIDDCTIVKKHVDASCEEAAYTLVTCETCGRSVKEYDEDSAPLTHDLVYTHIDGTNTHNVTCTRDGCSYVVTSACNGVPTGNKTPATCEAGGTIEMKCKDCGNVYNVSDGTKATDHNFKYQHSIDANGKHVHSAVCLNAGCDKKIVNEPCKITTVNPTCTKNGSESCSICGYSKVLAATGHPEDQIVILYKAPSIANGGYIQLTCKTCKEKLDYSKNATLAQGVQYKDLNYKNGTEADKVGAWFYDEAIFAKSFGLMQGEYDYFNGNKAITRGMVVTVLGRYLWGRLEDMSETEFNALIKSLGGNAKSFVDLKGDWYDRYAIALSTIGVVNGDGNYFKGDNNVTREQLAAFFLRYIDYIAPGSNKTYSDKIDTMTDLNTLSDWAKKEGVDRAAKIGIISGMNNKFNPQGTATRAQMATIMERIVRAHSEYPIVDVK